MERASPPQVRITRILSGALRLALVLPGPPSLDPLIQLKLTKPSKLLSSQSRKRERDRETEREREREREVIILYNIIYDVIIYD